MPCSRIGIQFSRERLPEYVTDCDVVRCRRYNLFPGFAAYSALLFFLIYKPLEAKVGKSYALVGGIAFSVVIAIVLATMGVNAITSLPLCIILAAAYTAIIYAYAAKFEKKKNRF